MLALAIAAALALSPGTATAHGGEDEPASASKIVRQAIAMMVNTPEDHMGIQHGVEEALEAEDTEGVDLTLVAEAAEAVEAGDLESARDLLEHSIGTAPGPTGEPAPGADEQTPEPATEPEQEAFLDEYRPDRSLVGGDWILLGLSVVAAFGGALLLRRANTSISCTPPSQPPPCSWRT